MQHSAFTSMEVILRVMRAADQAMLYRTANLDRVSNPLSQHHIIFAWSTCSRV